MHKLIRPVVCRFILSLIAVVFIVTGCVSTQRDCPVFFHPDYAKWGQLGGVGETLSFTDQNGVKEIFNVTQIESRAPFRIETDGSPVRSVPCGLTLREVLVKQNSTERILKEFTHFDYRDTDVTSENFWLRIFIDEAAFKQSDFVIDLRNRQTVIIENEFEDRFHSQLEIGGILYKDVITEQILDENSLTNPDQIRAVAIADGFGLVQYERVNGSVFSRVPQ